MQGWIERTSSWKASYGLGQFASYFNELVLLLNRYIRLLQVFLDFTSTFELFGLK